MMVVVDLDISFYGIDLDADLLLLVASVALPPAATTVNACEGDVIALI